MSSSSSLLQDVEVALPVRRQSRAWCWCTYLGVALMLASLVVTGAYVYRYHILEVSSPFPQGWESTSSNSEVK